MEHILYRIFKVILNIYKKKHGEKDVNQIKTRYYHILLTPETMKLLGSAKSKIINDENGENAPLLEINDVVLVHSNIVNNNYQLNLRVLYTFIRNKLFAQFLQSWS